MKASINIRPVQTVAEYRACEAIQKQVWQFADREIIPINELITIQRTGGLVLGAFIGRKQVGFAFGFAGLQSGKLIHSSRMLAVLPQYRNYDIGYRLKLAQRAFALKQGIKLVTWTFDPLQSLNAFFNIVKLGVRVRRYFVNLYGTSSSVLNKGVPTDRFLAEWEIKSPAVRTRLNPGQQERFTRANRAPDALFRYFMTANKETVIYKILQKYLPLNRKITQLEMERAVKAVVMSPAVLNILKRMDQSAINRISRTRKGLSVSSVPALNCNTPVLFMEVPYDFNEILRRDNKLAIDWRLKTRTALTHYFKKGYEVTDFLSPRLSDEKPATSYYILRHK